MGIYEFKEEDAFHFAESRHIKTHVSGDEIIFSICPYCKGGGGSRPDKNTFAMNRSTGAFNCKRSTCDAKGNMLTISKDFDFSLGRITDEYFKPRKVFRKFEKRKEPIVPKEAAIKFLESRGISEEIARRYEITTQTNRDNVIVFPFYNENGVMEFIKYRKADYQKGVDKAKEWCEKNCKPILFGMNHCNPDNKTLIITEGELDALSLAEAGIENAVSVPTGAQGFTFIPYVWNWIQGFDTVIIFGDHENGHITLLDDFAKRLRQKIKHVRTECYKDCKDANDILRKYGKEQLVECIETAIPLPVRNTVDLSEVEDIDIFQIEKVSTGIKTLDRLLYGGMPFGGVHLITAKAGSGKSTFASQLLIRAKHQGYKCFAYSGELPNNIFKAWMTFQVAGANCIFEYQNPRTGYEGYEISKTNKRLISEWYKGCIRIYDNTMIDDDDERRGLLKIIEEVIQQYGMRVILIDNLMTAMIMDVNEGTNEYAKQTDFVNKLRKIAIRYNAMILLVAHMRKNSSGDASNDEVAGSSNITNLAMLTISYDRDKKLESDERYIRLLKNRLFGKLETDGIKVQYDEKSRRIFGDGDDPNFDYGFNPLNAETYQIESEFIPLPEGDDIGL